MQMAIRVSYLAESEIEQKAEKLLAEYENTTGEPIKFPIPVAEITTYHLALRLGFADLHETLSVKLGPALSVGADRRKRHAPRSPERSCQAGSSRGIRVPH